MSSTPTLDALLDEIVDKRIAARAAELQLPTHVHQRCVERVVGLPSDDYLEAARSHAFASFKHKRLVYARTSDVIAWIESGAMSKAAAVDTDNDEAKLLAKVGARRVAR